MKERGKKKEREWLRLIKGRNQRKQKMRKLLEDKYIPRNKTRKQPKANYILKQEGRRSLLTGEGACALQRSIVFHWNFKQCLKKHSHFVFNLPNLFLNKLLYFQEIIEFFLMSEKQVSKSDFFKNKLVFHTLKKPVTLFCALKL